MIFGIFNVRSIFYYFILLGLITINFLIFTTNSTFQKIHILVINGYTTEVIDNKLYYVKDFGAIFDNAHIMTYTKVKKPDIEFDRTVIKVICKDSDNEHFYIRTDRNLPKSIGCEKCNSEVGEELIKSFSSMDVVFQDRTNNFGAKEMARVLFGFVVGTIALFILITLLYSTICFIIKGRKWGGLTMVHSVLQAYIWVLTIVTVSNLMGYYTGF